MSLYSPKGVKQTLISVYLLKIALHGSYNDLDSCLI